MKKIITHAATLMLLTLFVSKSFGQANTSLSNLTAPTAVNQHLVPDANNRRNLGSPANSWRTIYLDSNLFLKDVLFLHNKGLRNTFVGENAGISVTDGRSTCAIGYNALTANTTGIWNNALGAYAMYNNKTGTANNAMGYQALYFNTTGSNNTAVGADALFYNKTGNDNTAVGIDALLNHKTGNNNVAMGSEVLHDDTSGSENTAIGVQALFSNKNGLGNTAIGAGTLFPIENQNYNTAIGYGSGNYYAGHDNTFLGAFTYANANNYFNSTAIGDLSTFTASNQVRIGNSSVTSIGGQVSWTTLSDGRVKKNIRQNVPGLSFINKLNPVTYNLDLNAVDAITKTQPAKDAKGNIIAPTKEESEARQQKEKVIYTGLIAQDVEKAAKESGYNFSGVDAAKNDKDLYGIRYSDFVMPLIKAVQELSKENDELKARLDKIESKQNANETSSATRQQINTASRLEQNQPNPTASSTIIKYFVPEKTSSAFIKITNANAQEIKSIALTKGSNQVNFSTTELSAGTYFYSLIVDGKIAGTKQMIIAH